MKTIKIFLASSSELKDDRDKFRLFISEQNDLNKDEVYLKLVQWENYLDSISDSRLQNEYNKAIENCDIVLCLFFTKVGKYTTEEFNTAYQKFKDTGKPEIWTYFKDADIKTGDITDEINTLLDFQRKLSELGHYYTKYTNIDNLINKYRSQLDKFLPKFENEKTDLKADNSKGSEILNHSKNTFPDFNKVLLYKLINAVKNQSKKAADFLAMNDDWESNEALKSIVKRIVISSYAGVIGVYLRKIISIGGEQHTENKVKRYIENCISTSQITMQLVIYALISNLWDYKLKNNFEIAQKNINSYNKLFKNEVNLSLHEYLGIYQSIIDTYKVNKLELPFSELNELNIDKENELFSTIIKQGKLQENLDSKAYTIDNCLEAEKNVATILEQFSFLVQYKMVSLKEIDYAIQRNEKEGVYIHNYTILDGDNKTNTSNTRKVKKEKTPVISYSVLLCKQNLRQNINLAPFVIDYNALELEGGTKICMYSYIDKFDDLSINYSIVEDGSTVPIQKSKNPIPNGKSSKLINNWLANKSNRIDLNFDNMYKLFLEAKESFIGVEEEITYDF